MKKIILLLLMNFTLNMLEGQSLNLKELIDYRNLSKNELLEILGNKGYTTQIINNEIKFSNMYFRLNNDVEVKENGVINLNNKGFMITLTYSVDQDKVNEVEKFSRKLFDKYKLNIEKEGYSFTSTKRLELKGMENEDLLVYDNKENNSFIILSRSKMSMSIGVVLDMITIGVFSKK